MSPDIVELLRIWPLGRHLGLPPGSVSIVAGAYKGRVMQLIAETYPDYGTIHGFEPQAWAIEEARRRLGSEQEPGGKPLFRDCFVHPFAIGTETNEVWIDEWGTDAASILSQQGRTRGLGIMLEYALGLSIAGVDRCDLFVMNMEGYEFELIPWMWKSSHQESDRVEFVHPPLPDRLCVQWHPKAYDGDYEKCQSLLCSTHVLVFDDAPRWQYWLRKAPE